VIWNYQKGELWEEGKGFLNTILGRIRIALGIL
jgi:hypothetical protein